MKKLDKKDKKIEELRKKVNSLEMSLSYKNERAAQTEGELKTIRDKWNEYKQHIESRELPAEAENRWLRETLRMVIVSADKFDALKVQNPTSWRNNL